MFLIIWCTWLIMNWWLAKCWFTLDSLDKVIIDHFKKNSNWVVSDKEEKIRVRSQGWHEQNHTWYNIRVPKICGVSREGKYIFSIPWYGSVLGWGVYISEHLWNTPSCETPPGDEWSMMNVGPYYILIRGGLLMDRCHPATF